eukprot:TRINITY_DN151_c0_g1_i9.p1 TRINITY_DN151_c0_g1~~TRINITY_DN151_c0_g1_i9.p1  ORF type:complete len:571 (+),score=100.45 TRINITY_DN151_c0_g1_i9:141-1853(+)
MNSLCMALLISGALGTCNFGQKADSYIPKSLAAHRRTLPSWCCRFYDHPSISNLDILSCECVGPDPQGSVDNVTLSYDGSGYIIDITLALKPLQAHHWVAISTDSVCHGAASHRQADLPSLFLWYRVLDAADVSGWNDNSSSEVLSLHVPFGSLHAAARSPLPAPGENADHAHNFSFDPSNPQPLYFCHAACEVFTAGVVVVSLVEYTDTPAPSTCTAECTGVGAGACSAAAEVVDDGGAPTLTCASGMLSGGTSCAAPTPIVMTCSACAVTCSGARTGSCSNTSEDVLPGDAPTITCTVGVLRGSVTCSPPAAIAVTCAPPDPPPGLIPLLAGADVPLLSPAAVPAVAAPPLAGSPLDDPNFTAAAEHFSAGDLALADGVEVESWTGRYGFTLDRLGTGPTFAEGVTPAGRSAVYTTGQRLRMLANPLTQTQDFSALVVYKGTAGTNEATFFLAGSGTGGRQFRGYEGGTQMLKARVVSMCTMSQSDSGWRVAGVTYDGATVKMFHNGVLTASCARTDTFNTGAVFHVLHRDSDEYFKGWLAELVVWNEALSDAAMTAAMDEVAVHNGI